MKLRYVTRIGDQRIITKIADATVDGEATKKKIAPMITADMTDEEINRLFMDNLEYAKAGPEAVLVSDGQGEAEQKKLSEMKTLTKEEEEQGEEERKKTAALKEHLLLTESLQVIQDWRGVEYHLKRLTVDEDNINWKPVGEPHWFSEKMDADAIGVPLPEGAVLQEYLTREQQREIADQKEADRLAALTPEQKEEEKKSKLQALAREALQKAGEAELLEESFDKLAWLRPRKAELEAKYAS